MQQKDTYSHENFIVIRLMKNSSEYNPRQNKNKITIRETCTRSVRASALENKQK